jgi:hypothetical protein
VPFSVKRSVCQKHARLGSQNSWIQFQIKLRNGFEWLLMAGTSGEARVAPGAVGFQAHSKGTQLSSTDSAHIHAPLQLPPSAKHA